MTTITHTWEEKTPSEAYIANWWREVDKLTIAAVLALFTIGIILSLSSTPPLAERNNVPSLYYVIRHSVFGIAGITIMILISLLKPKEALRVGCWVFVISFILLVLLPFIGTGFDKGSKRWLSLGFASLQPSEFLKPGLIIFSAWLFHISFENKTNFGIYLSLFLTLVCCLMLVLQPDFGQTGLVFIGWCVIYFTAGAPILLLLLVGGAFVGGVILAYLYSSHFASRIDTFVNSFFGTSVKNDQVGISFEAIQNGSIFGTGVGEGNYKWNLPDGHTDFIIAIAAEEYGLFLVLAIILLYFFIAFRALIRLYKAKDNYIWLAGAGLVINVVLQTFINLAVAAKLFPPTGMTLPLISYGGSSMLAIGIALGLLLCFTRTQENMRGRLISDETSGLPN